MIRFIADTNQLTAWGGQFACMQTTHPMQFADNMCFESGISASYHKWSCVFFRLDRYSKETTVVNQIFGGFLRSQGNI